MFVATTQGCVFSRGELESLLTGRGFSDIAWPSVPGQRDPNVVIARK